MNQIKSLIIILNIIFLFSNCEKEKIVNDYKFENIHGTEECEVRAKKDIILSVTHNSAILKTEITKWDGITGSTAFGGHGSEVFINNQPEYYNNYECIGYAFSTTNECGFYIDGIAIKYASENYITQYLDVKNKIKKVYAIGLLPNTTYKVRSVVCYYYYSLNHPIISEFKTLSYSVEIPNNNFYNRAILKIYGTTEIVQYGHIWSTQKENLIYSNPYSRKTKHGAITLNKDFYFTSEINDLTPNINYYIRAYAIDKSMPADSAIYSEIISFVVN